MRIYRLAQIDELNQRVQRDRLVFEKLVSVSVLCRATDHKQVFEPVLKGVCQPDYFTHRVHLMLSQRRLVKMTSL